MPEYKYQNEIPCGDGARLLVAFDGDWWDVAYYRLPKGAIFEERFAIRKRVLLDGIRVVFCEADEPFDADDIIRWLRKQPYGLRLRQLDRSNNPEDYDPKTAEIPY